MGYPSSSSQTWRLGLTGFATISHCGFWLLPSRSPIIMPSVPAKSRSPQPLGLVWANWEKLGKICAVNMGSIREACPLFGVRSGVPRVHLVPFRPNRIVEWHD